MHPDWLSEIDHTADAGIGVTAPDVESLFERAAWAMFTVLTDPAAVQPSEAFAVDVDASDRDDLLVRWLTELNFLHLTEGVLLSRFDIDELSDRHLSAAVYGEPIDPDRHEVYTEIKAVTYHALIVEERPDGWHAQVIFDM